MPNFVKLPTPIGYVRVNVERVTHILEADDVDQCIVSFGHATNGVLVDLRPADAVEALEEID